MRLIDADEFKEFILAYGKAGYRALTIEKISELIDGQSTAYDVEKVVERLKANEEDAIKSIIEQGKTEFHLIKIMDLKELFETYTKEQIEIVKSGGIAND